MSPHRANYAFIDNENVNVSVQKQKWKIDRGKFRAWLEKEWKVRVAYMFMGYLEEYQPMYEFFTSLGYTLVFRPMNPNPDVPNKGNIDTDLVLQAMIDRPEYHQAVIVSGDGDFASLVKYLKGQKKLATVIVPNERRYSGFLNEAAGGKIVSLNLLKTELGYKPSGKRKEEKPKQAPFSSTKELIKHTPKQYTKRPAKKNAVKNSSTTQRISTQSLQQNKGPNTQPPVVKQTRAALPNQQATKTPPPKTQQKNGNGKKKSNYNARDDAFYA